MAVSSGKGVWGGECFYSVEEAWTGLSMGKEKDKRKRDSNFNKIKLSEEAIDGSLLNTLNAF